MRQFISQGRHNFSQRADSQTKILSGQALKKAQQDLNLHEIPTPVVGTVRILGDSHKTGQVPNVQVVENRTGVLLDQRDYQTALGQEVPGLSCAQSGRDLYPVTEGTCETSRTGSSQEGVLDKEPESLSFTT